MFVTYRAVKYFRFTCRLLLDDYLGVSGILLYRLDAVGAACHRLIAFADGNDLAVRGLQAEAVLAGLVEIDLELRMLLNGVTFLCLILYGSYRRILLNAGNTVLAGSSGGIDLRCSNDFAVAGLKIELYAGLGLLDKKRSHVFSSCKYKELLHAVSKLL